MKTLSILSFAALCGASLPLAAQNIERMRLTDGDLSCTQIFAEVQQMDTMIRVMGSAPAPMPAPAAGAMAGGSAGSAALPSGFNPFAALGNVQAASVGQASNAQVQALMLASNDPRVRAAAYDPAAVAQTAALLQNPQLAVAAQRAAAAGVNPAMIQGQLNSVAMAQQATNAFQANSQAGASAAPAVPAAAANALGGLFGALAGARGGSGGAQAASLFGSLTQNAGQAQPQAPAAVAAQAAAPAAPQGNAIVAQAQGRKEHLTSLFLNKGCKMSEVQR